MRVHLKDIEIFSRCPRYYSCWKSIERPKLSKRFSVIQSTIQKCYLKRTEYLKKAEWRVILGWIDKSVFKSVNALDQNSLDSAQKLSESIILPIRCWYEQYYLKEKSDGYINVPLEVGVGNHVIYDTAQAIKLDDIPVLVYIDEQESSNLKLFNDIYIRGLAWLAARQFNLPEVYVEHFGVGTETIIGYNKLKIKQEYCKNMDKILNDIASSMAAGVDYPSVTAMCKSCQFKSKCFF